MNTLRRQWLPLILCSALVALGAGCGNTAPNNHTGLDAAPPAPAKAEEKKDEGAAPAPAKAEEKKDEGAAPAK